jgi:elongation factor Ts
MTQITAALVKDLRERTGVGMMDCKKALTETNGDIEAAIKLLREKGIAGASKRSGRITKEGLIHAYIHPGSKLGVMVEINCETDFVARTDGFKSLANDIAMQVAAAGAMWVRRDEVPAEVAQAEREIYEVQNADSGKPPEIAAKIVDGRMNKWYAQVCLLEQPFVKDDSSTVEEMVKGMISKTGENINVARFVRFQLGETATETQEPAGA